MQPTVGRVVYYKSYGTPGGEFPKKDRAAIVTDVRPTTPEGVDEKGEKIVVKYEVRLAVLNPEGLFFSGWLNQGDEGGMWNWMPYQLAQVTGAVQVANASVEVSESK